MIGYLEGAVTDIQGNTVTVRTSGGVGYDVHVTLTVLAELTGRSTAALHVVTIVRADALELYGFDSANAKGFFRTLIQVSGIGPKAALAMLSAFSPDELGSAILRQDIATISSVPGIGKKTANRLCVELGDRISQTVLQTAAAPEGRGDLISALTNLGFPEKDVITVLRNIPADETPFTDQLRAALALLNKS